jgi:hypothetical protein
VQNTLSPAHPAVGLFPPGADTRGGDTLLAASCRTALPLNVYVSGYGVTSAAGSGIGVGGRTVLEGLSKGGENGTSVQAGADYMNSDLNGGQSFGAGGANQTEGPSSGQSSQVAAQQPSTTVTLQDGPARIYGG